jgi:hypothetical protein
MRSRPAKPYPLLDLFRARSASPAIGQDKMRLFVL